MCVYVCVPWYLQHQEEKHRGRKGKDDSEKDENVPPLKRLYSIGTPAYRSKSEETAGAA